MLQKIFTPSLVVFSFLINAPLCTSDLGNQNKDEKTLSTSSQKLEPQEKLEEGWVINGAGHLYKEYTFKNFKEPMAFANKIAEIAEAEKHHPDLKITWGLCSVEIWTHKTNGLTKKDYSLMTKISGLK